MITSTANKRVKWVAGLQKRRKVRQQEGFFAVEGLRLAEEAAKSGMPPRLVFHTEGIDERSQAVVESLRNAGAEVEEVTEQVMAACSDTESPSGLLVVMPLPEIPLPSPLTLVLVVDHVADPGNLGTILRTALAAGVEAVFLTEGTVDAFSPKVVRGAMGAQFRLPIQRLRATQLLEQLQGVDLWLAEARAGEPYHKLDWRRPVGLVVGGEAHGAQPVLREGISQRVQIPMPGEFESLNASVAAAIILFEAVRQRGGP